MYCTNLSAIFAYSHLIFGKLAIILLVSVNSQRLHGSRSYTSYGTNDQLTITKSCVHCTDVSSVSKVTISCGHALTVVSN